MRTKKTAFVLTALAAAGALTLAACSSGSGSSSSKSSDDSAAQIKASLAAAKQAKTFHVVADGTDSGNPIKLDLHYGSNGTDGSVTAMGTVFQVKYVDTDVYFEAPAAFWRKQAGAQGDTVAAQYGDKWVKTSKDSTFGKDFAEFSSGQTLLKDFTDGYDSSSVKGAKLSGKGNIDGVATKTYSDKSGKNSIDIAASGQPYPLKVVEAQTGKSKEGGTILLTDWNKPYTVTAPAQSVPLPS